MYFDVGSIKKVKTILKGVIEYEFLYLKMKGRNYSGTMKFHTETSGRYIFFGKWKTKNKVLKSTHRDIDVYYEDYPDTDKFGNQFILRRGDKVIHKSDNPTEGFNVVKVVGFDDMNGKVGSGPGYVPIVEYPDGSQYSTFAVLIPYHKELADLLEALNPIEQWNLLCRDHCQSSKGDEFPLDSERVPLQWYKMNSKRLLQV